MTPKILLAFKHPKAENPAACHVGMGVTASNTAMGLREARIAADAMPVANGEFLWARLSAAWAAYTHVVLCAPYIDPPFVAKLVAAFPLKRFALIYHSNLGFLSVDRFAARSLAAFLKTEAGHLNFRAASNSEKLCAAMTGVTGQSFLWLPNVYHLPHVNRRQRTPWRAPMPLHVGLFGAARVLKNWLSAAAAAMIMARQTGVDLSLHVNSGRDEGAGGTRESLQELLAMNPKVRLVDVPWLSSDDFRRYLYGIDLMLQPSFTETFNNVTADGCACGVPSVVSSAIAWAPAAWKADADSASDIAAAALRLLADPNAVSEGWKALDSHNDLAMEAWRKWLA